MRRLSRILIGAYASVFAAFLAYALWLVAAPDPDGGRHPFGIAILAGLGLIAFVLALRLSGRGRR